MDARTLAMEMAPVIMWQQGHKTQLYEQYWSNAEKNQKNPDSMPTYSAWDMLEGEVSSHFSH